MVGFVAGNDRPGTIDGRGKPCAVFEVRACVFVFARPEAVDVRPGSLAADEGEFSGCDTDDVAVLGVQLLEPLCDGARTSVEGVWDAGRDGEPGAGDVAKRTEEDVVYDCAECVNDELEASVCASLIDH